MKERPILFSGPMVRAILEERKTQTRRLIKDHPPANCAYLTVAKPGEYPDARKRWGWTDGATTDYAWHPWIGDEPAWQTCPYGELGDRLWVREPTIITPKYWDDMRTFTCLDSDGDKRWVQYLATSPNRDAASDYGLKTTPSIYMPRWASRITLEITDLRVQRLQEISAKDCEVEGVQVHEGERMCHAGESKMDDAIYRDAFVKLWNSINAKRGFGWNANPWVWTVTFRRVTQ